MDLLALAVPFFLLAILLEWGIDRFRGSGLYRANDAINSLSAGTLSTTFGYFTGFLALLVWGLVLENFALIDMPLEWFDTSARGILLWIIAALAWDLSYYWFHRLSHVVSIFWAAHAVHHQSEDYNLSTALRQTSTGFVFKWLFYVPLFLIGFPLEVLMPVYAVNLIYQFWVHTQIVRRMGPLDYILVTPSNHRVHHAQNERYIDKNYGGILILWDRLFGTFQDEVEDDPVVFGVRKPLSSWNPFWANLQVYDYLLFDAVRTQRWRDKIGVWFRRTGWRPADVAAQYPKSRSDLTTFTKFDPALAPAMRHYVLAQFLVAVVISLGIAELFVSSGPGGVVVQCLALWAQLYALGTINGGKIHAVRIEQIRLLLVVPVAAAVLQSTVFRDIGVELLWSVVSGYVILSIGALTFAEKQSEKQLLTKYI